MKILVVMAFAILLPMQLFCFEKEVELHIKGMTCPTCTRAVKVALSGVDGVKSAKVYLNGEKAIVVLDKDVPLITLDNAVKKIGYRAMAVDKKSPSP
jgi:periplasmic mercuric ion binding protein